MDNIRTLVCFLLLLMALDYGVALLLIWTKKRKKSSKTGAKGIAKKVATLVLVGVGELAGYVFEYPSIGIIVCIAYIINEIISIIENAEELGVKAPSKLKELIESERDKTELNFSKQDEDKQPTD